MIPVSYRGLCGPRILKNVSFFYIRMRVNSVLGMEITFSRVGDPEKEAYFVRNKDPTVIWILNDQNSSTWSLEEY